MAAENQNHRTVYKFCAVCKGRGILKPVKAILLRKGRMFDDYLCLEPLKEGEKPHVFKVETSFNVAMQSVGTRGESVAATVIIHKWFEKKRNPNQEELGVNGEGDGLVSVGQEAELDLPEFSLLDEETATEVLSDAATFFGIEPSDLLEIVLAGLGLS